MDLGRNARGMDYRRYIHDLIENLNINSEKEEYQERLGSCDVYKFDGNYVLDVDVPGLTKKDIEIHMGEEYVTISGERPQKKDKDDREFIRAERTFRRFERKWKLPNDCDTYESTAKVDNGVLTITIPIKEKEIKDRIITIN